MKLHLSIDASAYIIWVLDLYLLGIEWTAAIILAPLIHELGHIWALKFCKIPVYKITVRAFGARIESAPMHGYAALICACAGPIAGSLLLLLLPIFPQIAVCAFVQTIINLLPIPQLDGWRIIQSLTEEKAVAKSSSSGYNEV